MASGSFFYNLVTAFLNGKEAFSMSKMYTPFHWQEVMLEKYLYRTNACIELLSASYAITKKSKHLKVYQQETGKWNHQASMQIQELKSRYKNEVTLLVGKDAKDTLLTGTSSCKVTCAACHCAWTSPAWNYKPKCGQHKHTLSDQGGKGMIFISYVVHVLTLSFVL